jgi:hypothetical protein
MEWKTASVEAGGGFSKLVPEDVVEHFRRQLAGSLRVRQWDAKRWVDDVSTQLL